MRYVNHKIRWKGGILALLISAMLLYTLATVYAEEETGPQADVSVEWRPEVSEAETGEKVAIRLSSYIDPERTESADIKIALTEEEASLLGGLPEGLALEDAGSGGVYLAFCLTQEQPKLDVELTASAPAKITASASIEVTEEDIQIEAEEKTADTPEAAEEPDTPQAPEETPETPDTPEEPEATGQPETPEETPEETPDTPDTPEEIPGETPEETKDAQEETAPPSSGEGTPKAGAEEKELSLVQAPASGSGADVTGGAREEASLVLEKKGGSLSFTADFGWTVSLAGEEDGDGNPVFTAETRSENREETGTVYTKEQSLAFTLALPEGYALGGGEPVFDEASQALKVNGNMLIQISGLPETAVITEVRKADGSTLSFTVARNTEWNGESGQEPEELSDLGLALTVDRGGLDALKTDAEEAEAGAQAPETQGADALPEIRLGAKLCSVPLAGETKTQDVSEILSLGAGTQGTDAGQQEENGGLIETLALGPSIVAEESKGGFRQEIFWADNRNEGGKRPEEGAYPEPILHFTVTEVDEHGQPVEGASGKQMELTKDNMGELGLTVMPEPTIAENAVGNYTLTYSNLPTLVSQTDIYGDTTWYKIEWDRMTPSTADGYALMEVTEEMIDEGEVQSVETPGWYYVLETDFTFELQFRWGDQGAANEAIKDVLGHLELLVQAGTVSGEYPLNQIPGTILKEDWDEDLDSVKITISGLWKYNLDGSQLGCSVINPNESSQISGTDIPSAGLDAGDSFALTYDNERVPNYGSVTDRLHNGGTLYLTLTGEKDYNSKKVWLDEGGGTSKRPAGELQLWRYRAGQSYTTAAAVRDPGTNEILTVNLDPKGGDIRFEDLPKYDSEGYEYIYVVREYMESTTKEGEPADAYEQVFGTVQEDGTVDDTILVPDSDGDLIESETLRESGNTFLYNGGTLSNRITDTVQTEASKTWKAAAFQADFDDVTVVLTLQCREKDSQEEWQEAKNADGSSVTETLDEFTAENLTASVSRSMPRYNAFGKELEYRWVETAVYKGEKLDDNLFTPDEDGDGGSFTLIQEGEEIEYVSDSRIDPDGEGTAEKPYDTEVVNSIANTLNYYAEKIWLDDTGKEYIPQAGEREAEFNIYRVLSGGSLSGDDDPVAKFTMDGAADEKPTEITTPSGEEITVQETEPWKAVVTPLQMYDSEGREYEYILLETEKDYVPTYETIRDEDGNYWTTITNGPGSGNRITVRKEWIDDSDLLHREPITVGVYDSKTSERIADVTLSEGFWQQQVGIGEREPEDVYILEEKVGDFEVPLSFGEDPEDSGPKEPTYMPDNGSAGEYTAFQVETDNHRYEVTYRAPEEIAGETFHTVVNRRLGSVDVTVKKEWKDGDGEIQDAIAGELNKLQDDQKLTLAMKLDFADDSRRNTGNFHFEIDYTNNTVTISPGNEVPIQKPADEDAPSRENMENSTAIQKLDLGQPESTYYFWNLPKYDLEGGVVHYQVTEVWLDSDNEEVNLTELAQQEPDIYGDLYDLWKEYSTSSEETYATEALHDVDTHTITVTNRLTGTKEILWHKQWNDAYNNQSGQRPDIYLDIYAVSHEKNGDQVTEKPVLYRENYRWTYSEAADPEPGEAGNPLYNKDVHWHAVLENVPKYDALGYEIQYYAVEKMLVDGASFDYQETAYQFAKDPENPTKLTEIGTVSAPAEDAINEGYVFDVSGMEGEGTDPCYALLEDGTFVNTIAGEVSIQGRKLWGNLPSEYPSVDLPEVTFGVYQKVQGAAEEPTDPAATLKVTDWAAIDANGSYTFEINYMGQNKMIVDEDPDTGETTVTFTGPSGVGGTETDPKLPKYNPQGELYIYTLKELKIDWPEREGTGASQSPDWEKIFESAGIGNTYQIQNTYRDGDGRLSFKKFMYLPMNDEGNPEAYPGVRFKLTRTYTKNDGNRSEAELVEYIVWSSSEVMEAYKDLEEGAQKEGGLVEKTFTVDGLELYAPNGSPYVYQVTEIRENLQGYETWVADREVTVDNIGDIVGNGVQEPQGTHYEADGSEVSSGGIGAAEDENPPVSVTFINRRAEKQDTITLTGSKSWEDYGDVFDFRPEDITLTLSRRANAQPGQGNEIAKELVPETDYQINWDKDSEEDTWTYTITGKENSGELERNAPNGTPWIYTVKEEYTGDEYDVTPAGGEATVTAPSTGDGKMPELKNSLMTSASFKKEWRDAEGEPITEDYLGYDLTVEFQLQVAQAAINESGTVTKVEKWEDASDAYFKNLIGEDAYSKIFGADSAYQFSGELTGRIDADTWKTGCTFKNLPRVVKMDDKTIHLIYRVVETEIRFGNTVTTVTVNDSENNRTYTYEFTPETWFTPDYEKDASNSADTKIHINKLKTTGFTITKNWEGDGGNSYGTRPSTDRDGEDWEVCFVIQRTTTPDEADSWENLTTPEGTAWIERLTGTNAQGSVTLEVKGLPPADEDGKSYSYRAMELKPKEGSYADGKVEDEDIVPDGGEFHTAYTADYGEAGSGAGSGADSGSGNTAVTNTMATTCVYAEKLWRGDEKADKVTLELQYLGEDGKWKSFATPARVALDGETDTDTEERSWYEYEAWKAVWENVPVAMPGSKLENGATQYRAAETAPSGYIQVDSDEGIKTDNGTSYPEYTFTNTKAVSLEVTKDWRVTDEAVKKAVAVELWRTIGKIDEAGKAEQVKDKNGAVMTKVLDASSGWKAEFTALPKYNEAGEPYRYYAKEVSIDGDADALSDFRILYEHTGEAGDDSFTTAVTNIELMDLVGTKIWKDNGNAYLTRPESIELILERSTQENPDPKKDQGWTEVDADTLEAEGAKLTWTKGSGGVWRWKYTDLRSHTDDGEACTYRVREKEPEIPEDAAAGLNDSYQGTQVGNVITNTLTGTTKVTVTKKWVDLNDQRGGRPDSVTIVLLADGAECKRAEISAGNIFSRLAKALGGQEDDTWAYTFENLPKYDEDGKRIEYTVKEEETEGYETSYDGYLITNTSENGALSLEKTVTGSGAEKGRYFTFTLVLKDAVGNALAGEYEYTGSGKGTLRSGDALRLKHGQKITIWGLPAGTRYVITESGSDGYEVTASGASGTVEGGKVSEAAFENHRDNTDGQGGSGGGSSLGSSPSKTGSVRTGDSSRPWLWAALVLLAAAGLAGIAAYMTKRKTGNIKKHSDEKKNR